MLADDKNIVDFLKTYFPVFKSFLICLISCLLNLLIFFDVIRNYSDFLFLNCIDGLTQRLAGLVVIKPWI